MFYELFQIILKGNPKNTNTDQITAMAQISIDVKEKSIIHYLIVDHCYWG